MTQSFNNADGIFYSYAPQLTLRNSSSARLSSYKNDSRKEKECKCIIHNCEQMEKDVEELAIEFQRAGDLDGDGKISYEEFEAYMQKSSLCKTFLKMLAETTDVLRHEEGNFNDIAS